MKNFRIGAIFFLFLTLTLPLAARADYSWIERQPAGAIGQDFWQAAATDDTGTNLMAAQYGGRLWISQDGGGNWTESRPAGDVNRDWVSVGSSSDGGKLVAASYAGRIWISSNGGSSWTESRPDGDADNNWQIISVSTDGDTITAGEYPGRLYISNDGGTTWSETQPKGNLDGNWYALASDSDGSNLMAGEDGGRMWVSANGGGSWVDSRPSGADVDKVWSSAVSDGDGSVLFTGGTNGRLYVSANGGGLWTETRPAGDLNYNWISVGSDSTGENLLAAIYGGRIYGSADGGDTWTETEPNGASNQEWGFVSVSPSGEAAVALTYDGRLYVGEAADAVAPSRLSLSPADNATDVALSSTLAITFDEAVDVETGNITIKKSSDDSVVEAIGVTGGSVTGTGTTTITINPSLDLDYNTNYYVNIDATAFDDAAGNSYAGIADATTWNFSTESRPPSSSGSVRRPVVVVAPSPSTVPASSVCKPGDLFSITTGEPCPNVSNNTITTPGTTNTPNSCALSLTLKVGSTGEQVKCLQNILKITADGIFGPITKASVVSFQTSNGLTPDGIVGPLTRKALGF